MSVLPFLAACTSAAGTGDVVGPFTGATHRYAIDHYTISMNNNDARTLGDDLDGDGAVDNRIGMTFASLSSQGDLTTYASSIGAVGLLPSTVLIQADALDNDDSVGVSYIGRPGDTSVPVGGRFVDGVFASNRTATTSHGAQGTLVLPVFIDADPTGFVLNRGEIDLTPDGTGFTGLIRGEIAGDAALQAAATSLQQMVMSNPQDHAPFGQILDANKDGRVTADEVAANSFVKALLEPDLTTGDSAFLSIGFGVHLIPCDTGTCLPTTIADSCHDRVRDNDETDVDCGGSCQACGFDAACLVASDCQTGTCDAGTCAAPTCSDGVQDGFEQGVDCGNTLCGECAGQTCSDNASCHSGVCGGTGTCH
ncbi:MAG: hypothetical protein ABI591_16865 [Kofleriaceae bacterium]